MDLFKSHTARIACGGNVLLRRDMNDGTLIEVQGIVRGGAVHDPRPIEVVELDLRSQGLNVVRM